MTTNIASELPTYTDDELGVLTPSALVELLIRDEDRTPRSVIDRCAVWGDVMVEYLGARLDDEHLWSSDLTDGEWWLRLHAAMILGLITSKSAGLLLVQLMRRISLAEEDDLQDWLAGHWRALFANKPAAVIEATRALCENRMVDWYIRVEAAEVVVAAATRTGDERLEHELDWLAARISDDTDEWEFRICAASGLLNFPRERHRNLLVNLAEGEAERAKGREWSGVSISVNEVNSAFEKTIDLPGESHQKDPWHFYARGSIARRQDRWAEEEAESAKLVGRHFDDGELFEAPAIAYIRPTERIGRNDSCPCGGGKKYKKCCLQKEQT